MGRARRILLGMISLIAAAGAAGAAAGPGGEAETVVVDLRGDGERESGESAHPDHEIITLDPAVAAAFGFGDQRTWKLSELKKRLGNLGLQLLEKDGNPL